MTTYESIIGEYHAFIPEPATYENGGFCDTMCSIVLTLDADLTYTLSISQANNLKPTLYTGYWEMKKSEIQLAPAARKGVASGPSYKGESEQAIVSKNSWSLAIVGSNLVGQDIGFEAPVRFQRELIIF